MESRLWQSFSLCAQWSLLKFLGLRLSLGFLSPLFYGGLIASQDNRAMKMLFVGNSCKNNCFAKYGGCDVHKEYESHFPISIDQINAKIREYAQQHTPVFVYTPDIFSDVYFEPLFKKLEKAEGGHVAVNASVRTLTDKIKNFGEILEHGITEIWLGVESGSLKIRNRYGKPRFTNKEVLAITNECKRYGIKICWYLINGPEDDDRAKLLTYNLMVKGNPSQFRFAKVN